MRYKYLFFMLFAGLSACSFQVDALTPEPSATLTVPTPTTFSATELLSATPPTVPTLAPTTVLGTPDSNIAPIQFSPNGTYIDVADGIQGGSSKRYSISALKGQVMSISIHQGSEGDWVYIPIQIIGADGKTLCPAAVNAECTFWRGVLPATQEYFVTLTPVNPVNFTMRVAINPPGVATQSFQYLSWNGRASLSHTDEFALVRFSGAEVSRIVPELTLGFVDTNSYLNTNLFEAFFLFGSSSSVDMVQTCTQPISFGGSENILGEKDVNGVKFVHSAGGGVAAGNIYEQTYYRAVHQGICYEVTFFVHYGNIGNYSPELGVKEFDRAALLQKFEAILSTLVIK